MPSRSRQPTTSASTARQGETRQDIVAAPEVRSSALQAKIWIKPRGYCESYASVQNLQEQHSIEKIDPGIAQLSRKEMQTENII